ncbi:predicted protein [Arabidopsis lyrata subsp. lyrata]|uniref:Predicted protein n=1 Tax=Arabidopsis lyrata subsp. lyrata TaxID=81972 RepID=D7M218_ARALL|nr:predicted protein [Arabidopsis lyrata subsp. lyrata]
MEVATQSDAFLVLGSSLMTMSAYRLVWIIQVKSGKGYVTFRPILFIIYQMNTSIPATSLNLQIQQQQIKEQPFLIPTKACLNQK